MDIDSSKIYRLASLYFATYTLICGPKQEPVNYSIINWSHKRQTYRKQFRKKCEVGDAALNLVTLYDLPDIKAILNSQFSKFITFSACYYEYYESARDLIVNSIHTIFLKAKAADRKEDNTNWWEAICTPFENDYWKADCKKVEILEK